MVVLAGIYFVSDNIMTPINYQDPPPATINFTDGHNASMIATFLNLYKNKGD